ncbi:hypothetical protein PO909_014667 [Leuciscus waleckii]
MGVTGLWKLLESTGKPINPETLEGKILAVDISIWLNQAVKGVRDRDGNAVLNAHLLTLFHRLCKLLFFRIRPVFVYDGDAPLLKKQTLAIRRQRREEMSRESRQTNEKLLHTFLKRQAIKAALGDRSEESVPSLSSVRRDDQDDIYVLPALPPDEDRDERSSEEEGEGDESLQTYSSFQEEIYHNPNSVDINSEEFSLMPPEIKHEILKELKEFNKRRRTLYHKPPERSGEFSQYQLAGLLQRNKLNQRLEGVQKEMNHTMNPTGSEEREGKGQHVETRRLVSEDSAHYVLIKGSQKKASAPESRPAPALWSSSPWDRKAKPKGKPEPLWRPVTETDEKKNKPSSSSSCHEEDPPASPRTLQAIQNAMMDSSSEEEDTRPPDDDGSVSPRTLHAIQNAMMDPPAHKHKTYVITSSSDDEEEASGSKNQDKTPGVPSSSVETREHPKQTHPSDSSDPVSTDRTQENKPESEDEEEESGSEVETREPGDGAVNLKQTHPRDSSDPVSTDRTQENKPEGEDHDDEEEEESLQRALSRCVMWRKRLTQSSLTPEQKKKIKAPQRKKRRKERKRTGMKKRRPWVKLLLVLSGITSTWRICCRWTETCRMSR